MNRRSLIATISKYAAAIPIIGMASTSPQAQTAVMELESGFAETVGPSEGAVIVGEFPTVTVGDQTVQAVMANDGLFNVIVDNVQVGRWVAGEAVVDHFDGIVHALQRVSLIAH
jgi:hypothetical protein